ncbi:TPA: hypothetical protein V0S21_000393 [Streptococcus pneumoniae]|nr:hypothetical protein [Streptococcus pneumoniae]HEW3030923.1 hypothetical protein [Streptococcus pneumoniae]
MTEKVRTVSLSKSVLFEGRNRIGCSKHSFEVADKADSVLFEGRNRIGCSKHSFEVADKADVV